MNGKKIGGWIVRVGIAAVEDDMRQTYTVKHIRKGLTLLSYSNSNSELQLLQLWEMV